MLSSAVSIASPDCGTPIEIGVKQSRNEIVKGVRDVKKAIENEMQSIGFSTVDNPFFLLMWLNICFEEAEICVRPVSAGNFNDSVYHRSSTNILKY